METTLTLRNRLGFNEVALWKQFCARRLHLIHTLSLNLRKASEQEEQVRVLAAELCAEYGFGPNAQCDFEKLLIAGIQSVRRNQKRSARHPHGYSDSLNGGDISRSQIGEDGALESGSGAKLTSPRVVTPLTPMGMHSHSHGNQYFDTGGSADSSLQGANNQQSTGGSWQGSDTTHTTERLSDRSTPGGPLATPMFQSLVVRLEVLRDMIGAGAATWIESSANVMAQMSAYGVLSTAVAAASVHGKLTSDESTAMRDSILNGPLLDSLRLALNPGLTKARLLERIGALAASLVHGPHLLSALQALCVSLAQASHGSESDMRFMLKPLARSDPDAELQLKNEATERSPKLQSQGDQTDTEASNSASTSIVQASDSGPAGHLQGSSAPIPQQVMPQSQPPPAQPAQQQQPAQQSQPPHQAPHVQPPQLQAYQQPPMPPHLIQQPMMHQQVMYAQAPPHDSQSTVHTLQQPMQPHVQFMIQNPTQVPIPLLGPHSVPLGQMPPHSQFPHAPQHQHLQQPSLPQEQEKQQTESQPAQQQPQAAQQPPRLSVDEPQLAPKNTLPEPETRKDSVGSTASSLSNADQGTQAMGFHVTGPDRLVTLECNNRTLKLTYSPLKATPPTLTEIIDNARKSFSIPSSTVVRVKDVQRNKIIESNSELIDAFTYQQVKLSLLLPPPMLMAAPRHPDGSNENEMRFTMLAPIFRTST